MIRRLGPAAIATAALSQPILDPEIQAFVDDVAQYDGSRDVSPVTFEDFRKRLLAFQSGTFRLARTAVEEVILPLTAGPVAVRIIRSEHATASLPIILYLHGRGWISGDCTSHDRLVYELAVGAGAAVAFVDYTTEPHGRFPVQNEQAYAALCYLVEHAARFGLIAERIAVAGDGSGGTMAASLALLAKRRRGPPILLQLLLYPALSMPDETSSYVEFADGPWLTAEHMRRYFLLQYQSEILGNPEALPGCAPRSVLEGLPPAVVITAESDVLRDDGEEYARKLVRAGVTVTATRYIGAIHDFMMLDRLADSAPSRAAITQACSALRTALHP